MPTVQDYPVSSHRPLPLEPALPELALFFRFLIRMDIVQSNPCDKLQRPQTSPSTPRGLSGIQVHKLLEVVPDSPLGLRYRAIILTLVLTGCRRAEVIGMKAGNLILDGDRAYYTYRGKGGKQGHRELPQPALTAISASLAAFGKDLSTMPADESLWPSLSHHSKGISSGTFYGNLQRYFRSESVFEALTIVSAGYIVGALRLKSDEVSSL